MSTGTTGARENKRTGWNQKHLKSWKKEHFLAGASVSDGEGNGTPLQYSCLENPMDGGAWWAAVHGVAKSRTRLSDFTFTFHFHALEKEMATWRIPGTGEPGGLPSLGLHRVGHDWSDLAIAGARCNRVLWREITGHSEHPLPTRDDSTHGNHQMVNIEII